MTYKIKTQEEFEAEQKVAQKDGVRRVLAEMIVGISQVQRLATTLAGRLDAEHLGQIETHRKVFEVIGDKTKCRPTEGQLAGLGFSSTKKDTFVVRVKKAKGQRVYNVRVGEAVASEAAGGAAASV